MKPAEPIYGLSRNASDLFRIAVLVAGFDRGELMIEIHRRSQRRATVQTVCGAMDAIYHRTQQPKGV